jgi:hypothetical protein
MSLKYRPTPGFGSSPGFDIFMSLRALSPDYSALSPVYFGLVASLFRPRRQFISALSPVYFGLVASLFGPCRQFPRLYCRENPKILVIAGLYEAIQESKGS